METLTASKIQRLERHMRTMPQIEVETHHYFADGMYAREMARDKGVLIIGKVHKKEHLYIVTKGAVLVFMDGETKEYRAPAVVVSKAGTKRVVFALEDSVCMTVHRTKNRDLEEIERELLREDKAALFDARNFRKALT